jgi:hypothetical protein
MQVAQTMMKIKDVLFVWILGMVQVNTGYVPLHVDICLDRAALKDG